MASLLTAQELAALVLVTATTGGAIAGLTHVIPDFKSPKERKARAEFYEYVMKKALAKQRDCKQTPPPKRT